MLRDAKCFNKVVIICGYVDMRKGIDGLNALIRLRYGLNALEKGTLFLFAGRSARSLKGLVWEGDGFLLLTKRKSSGRYRWPRTPNEARQLTQAQFECLMEGFSIEDSKAGT